MPTRNVVITDHQAALVERLVSSGRYQNGSEVLRAGLRLIERQEREFEERMERLRAAVRVGIEALERGEYTEFGPDDDLGPFFDAADES